MTTIIVKAHCDPENKQVKIAVIENDDMLEDITLQDGEEKELYAYDDREIIIKEVEK